MNLKVLLDTRKKFLIQYLKIQFERMDTDQDGLINYADMISLFNMTPRQISIVIPNFFKGDFLDERKFIKRVIKLIRELY